MTAPVTPVRLSNDRLNSHSRADAEADWQQIIAAPGWRLDRLVPSSPLYGANGMNWGPDGRLYVAQGAGSRVSALDLDGGIQTIVPFGSPVVAPDDLVFDAAGNMFITDPTGGAVWKYSVSGALACVADELPAANGIAIRDGRIFVNECRTGGRLVELGSDGVRVILDDLSAPNGMAFGPDGRLYYPLVFLGEVWAVEVETGAGERILDGLAIATAVKFSAAGRLTVTSAATGVVTQYDMETGLRSEIHTRPGFDNFLFDAQDRIILSYFSDGAIIRLEATGEVTVLAPVGLIEPSDVAVRADGAFFIADAALKQITSDGTVATIGTYTDPGFPGKIRGIAVYHDGRMAVATAGGAVALYDPATRLSTTVAEGLGPLAAIVCTDDGGFVVTQPLSGRVLQVERGGVVRVIADQLAQPTGLVLLPDGRCMVAESGAGLVCEVGSGRERHVVVQGLSSASGIALSNTTLFVLDPASRSLWAVDLSSGRMELVASHLPLRPFAVGVAPVATDAHRHAAGGSAADPNGVLATATSGVVHYIGIALDENGRICVPTDADGGAVAFTRLAGQPEIGETES